LKLLVITARRDRHSQSKSSNEKEINLEATE